MGSAGHRHPIGLTRREILQVGYTGLVGVGLSSLVPSARSVAGDGVTPRARSVVLVFLTGAPSHIDTLDPKPDAPAEVRGSFQPIQTSAPGIAVCEQLPLLAARADRFAIVRSMTHGLPSHEHATHFMLTGIDRAPPGSTHMASRYDWPCYASSLAAARPRTDGIPTGVMLPTYLNNGYGFSGQNAGQLGAKFDPWHIKRDPNEPGFRADELELPPGLTADQVADRRRLLQEIDDQTRSIDRLGASGASFSEQQARAFGVLTANRVRRAFELDREDPRLRDRYGRHMFGQSLLLARRLVEAGVPIVQANMGHMNNWDTHNQCCEQLKSRLLPPWDRAMSAFLDDMQARGLLDETLVVAVGEFGRTPKLGRDNGGNITGADGRDHWAGCFSAIFAGAGIRGGQVLGRSDKFGAYPASSPFFPSDLGATIFDSLGLDPNSEVHDPLGRPLAISQGAVMGSLWSGASV
jgi:hypothetical protein